MTCKSPPEKDASSEGFLLWKCPPQGRYDLTPLSKDEVPTITLVTTDTNVTLPVDENGKNIVTAKDGKYIITVTVEDETLEPVADNEAVVFEVDAEDNTKWTAEVAVADLPSGSTVTITTQARTESIPVTLELRGVPSGFESNVSLENAGEDKPTVSTKDVAKGEDGSYTAEFKVTMSENWRLTVRSNASVEGPEEGAAENVWTVTVTAKADAESATGSVNVLPAPIVKVFGADGNRTEVNWDLYGKSAVQLQDIGVDGHKLTGSVYYTTGWTNAYETANANGYFIVLKIGCPGVTDPTSIKVESYANSNGVTIGTDNETDITNKKNEAFTETVDGVTYAIVVKKLVMEKNEFKDFNIIVGKQKYAIDVSGLKPTSSNGVVGDLKVEVATDSDYTVPGNNTVLGTNDGQYTVAKLQSLETPVDNGDGTWTVSGTSKYVKDFTAFDSTLKDGQYIVLKFSYPGLKASEIKVNGNDLNKDGEDADGNDYGLLVKKITRNDTGTAKDIIITAAGKTYTIKLDIPQTDPDNPLDIIAAKDDDDDNGGNTGILGSSTNQKSVSELQSGIYVDGFDEGDGTKLKAHGTAYYVDSFEAFESGAKGYFIALMIEKDDADSISVKLYRDGGSTKPMSSGDVLVWKIEEYGVRANASVDNDRSRFGEKRPIELTINGVKYTIDLTDVELDNSKQISFTDRTGTVLEGGMDSKKIKDLQENVVVDTETYRDEDRYVVSGTLLLNTWSGGWGTSTMESHRVNPGWYIALQMTGANLSVWDNSSKTWKSPVSNEVNWLIKDTEGGQAEFMYVKAYERIFKIDLRELEFETRLGVEASTGELCGRNDEYIQDITVDVDNVNHEVIVSGTVYAQNKAGTDGWNWGDKSEDDEKGNGGWFLALNFSSPGGTPVQVINPIEGGSAANVDLSGDDKDIVIKIRNSDGTDVAKDRYFALVYETTNHNNDRKNVIQRYDVVLNLDYAEYKSGEGSGTGIENDYMAATVGIEEVSVDETVDVEETVALD